MPAPARSRAQFPFDLRQAVLDLVVVMVWLEALVVGLDVWLYLCEVVPSPALRGWFDATSERGLGSWVSNTQALLLALTLWALAAVHRQRGASWGRRAGWTALALLFSYLALDDATRLHERVGTAFGESAASAGALGRFPSYYWQLLFGPPLAAAGAFMAVFLWREFQTRRLRLLVVGALALLGGAVALDFIDGLGEGHPWSLYALAAERWSLDAWTPAAFGRSGYDTVVHLSRAVEESTEMLAMTLLWAALLLHLGATVERVELRWAPARPLAAHRPRARRSGRRTGRATRAFSRAHRPAHGPDRPDA